MKLNRRTLLKIAGAAGAAGLVRPAAAAVRPSGAVAVLVDTTRCVGCRGCEAACSEANGTREPERPGDPAVFETRRATAPDVYTVVNRGTSRSPSGEERYAKTQCMHCLAPACASACPVKALQKTPNGPVTYDASRCLGCRYCMLSCPFEVPKYEYDKAIPYVKKCTFCAARQAQGKPPACAEVCPSGALQFGDRAALIEEAHRRIWQNPEKYVKKVYGEEEVGGTSWLYISDVPFESLGLKPGLGTTPRPELTRGALASVPLVMTLWPPLLMGLYSLAQKKEESGEGRKEEGHE